MGGSSPASMGSETGSDAVVGKLNSSSSSTMSAGSPVRATVRRIWRIR